VLAYHNVVPAGAPNAGDPPLHLSADQFRRQLDLLQRWATITPLRELAADASAAGGARVAITFDDAYRGAVTIALRELRERGLPATMFVAPGRLGGDQFWWDTLAADGRIDHSTWHFLLRELEGKEHAIQAWAARIGIARHDVPDLWRSATIDELESAVYAGLHLAAHSWSHPNLACLSGPALAGELAGPRDWLIARFSKVFAPWLAFPYGMSSPEACDAAGKIGFEGAVRIEGGWARLPLVEPMAVPRLNVTAGISVDGFALRISGLLRA
jgi:peptidoglycan/xylan/chitin deacetylase (PgdA/CDA1 family)